MISVHDERSAEVRSAEPILTPSVNPVGIVEVPDGYHLQPRRYAASVRWAALAMVVVFSLVVIATTVASLGAYCLTSDGANTRALPARFTGAPVAPPVR